MKTLGFLFSFVASFIVAATLGASPAFAGVAALALTGLTSIAVPSLGPGLALFTITPVTFDGKQAEEGIIMPAFKMENFSALMTLVPGIKAREQVVYLPRLSKVTRTDNGCGTGVQDKGLTPTEKYWDPRKLKIWVQQCASELESTLWVWGLKNGKDRKDLDATDFNDYILEILPEAINEDVIRLAFLGDENEDTNANGGHLLNASDVDDYNSMTGFFPQLFAAVTAGDTRRVTISKNAQATFATQLALGSTDALDTFRAMLTGETDSRLKNAKGRVILCTTTLFENWITYKESQALDMSFVRQDKGYQTDVYRGVQIIAVDLWDRFIQADFQDGTKYYLPHRAILTTIDNLQFGVDTDNVADLDVFYDKTTELNNYKGGFKAEPKLVHEFMAVVAY